MQEFIIFFSLSLACGLIANDRGENSVVFTAESVPRERYKVLQAVVTSIPFIVAWRLRKKASKFC